MTVSKAGKRPHMISLYYFVLLWFLLQVFSVHPRVGIEWHANLQLNQNLITIGDMPRFILDSYEECRGPPHLFTLDKYVDASYSVCVDLLWMCYQQLTHQVCSSGSMLLVLGLH
jgi:hypothetical protein